MDRDNVMKQKQRQSQPEGRLAEADFERQAISQSWLMRNLPGWVQHYLCFHIGYPYFSGHYVSKQLIPLGQPNKLELAAYELLLRESSLVHYLRLAFMLSALSYFFLAITYPLVVFRDTNFKEPGQALVSKYVERVSEPVSYQFSCLESNCSARLLRENHIEALLDYANQPTSFDTDTDLVARLLVQLPHFTICHPTLSQLHGATQHIGYFGLLMALANGFTVMLGGTLLPIILRLARTGNLFIMFIVAPQATRRVVQERAKRLLDDLRDSYENHRPIGRRAWRIELHSLEQQQQHVINLSNGVGLHNSEQQPQQLELRLSPRNDKDDDYLQAGRPEADKFGELSELRMASRWPRTSQRYRDEFAADCVTAMRSVWWRSLAAKNMNIIVLLVTGNLIFEVASIPSLLATFRDEQERQLQRLGGWLNALGCAVWREPAEVGAAPQPIDFSAFTLNCNAIQILVVMFQCLWPFASITIFLAMYLLTNTELTCWLYELKFQLKLSLHLIQLLLERKGGGQQRLEHMIANLKRESRQPSHSGKFGLIARSTVASFGQQHFNMRPVREKYESLAQLIVFGVRRKRMDPPQDHLQQTATHGAQGPQPPPPARTRASDDLALQLWAAQLVTEQQLDLESAIEMLEKVYVGLRIYLEHIQHCELTMTIMIMFINIYIYGYVAIGVLFLRTIENYLLLPLMLMTLGWVTANFFIVSAAMVHAKGKKLHGLIWSLISITLDCGDERVRHMHLLWVRQVVAIDMDGGLGLRAFNLRITYARIIQMVIGSATMVLFALRYGHRGY